MGSFNATCIISNLPIEHGTPVRFLALTGNGYHRDGNDHICYVAGRWQLRCPPIRAEYNDYGSIEHIKRRLANRVFFESLGRDCVEKGVGDNQYPDVQVRKGMSHKHWLEALWEGRVYVKDYRYRITARRPGEPVPVYEPPEGMPSLSRIEGILKANNLPVVTDYGAEGFVLDEVSYGFIRIRYGRQGDAHEEALRPVVPMLDAAGYAAMITCGTGNYRNPAEILVAPKPVPKDAKDAQGQTLWFPAHGLAEDETRTNTKPRPVSQAMVREDVWQIMLKTPIESWRHSEPLTIAAMQKAANEFLDWEKAWKAEEAAFQARLAEKPTTITMEEREAWMMKLMGRMSRRDERDNIFQSAIRDSEGMSGFSLAEAFNFGIELGGTPEELEGFITDLAETAYVQWVYTHLHGQWHPTTNSGQDGNWKEHRAFLKALLKIKGRFEDE
jgi:hypothetical protein